MQPRRFFERFFIPLSRFALFLVYVWFGVLKVFGQSPATALVLELLDRTLPFIDPSMFMVLFGLFEMAIGILILIPRATRLALLAILLHLFMTTLPLIVLPHLIWTSPFVPTMEGQYIIKNILILTAAFGIGANSEHNQART